MNRFYKLLIFVVLLLFMLPGQGAFANGFTVTPGVEYAKGVSKWNDRVQSIHTVEIDVGRPEITVEALIPNPLTAKTRLTNLLKANSANGRHVVAGINASFFHVSSGAPAYLLASNNIVNTYGVISSGNTEYMSVPSAFGIDKEGKGRIGQFGYESTVSFSGETKKVHSINKARGAGEVVLYTPTYSFNSTRTNEAGMEIVLANLSSSIEENYQLGKPITAKVAKLLPYGSGNSAIPRDGAVLSIQGGAMAAQFANVKVGSELTLSVDLTNPWKQAKFVLASGPLLVQNGKVDMTIDPKSARASSINPRTAVAVNADGSKVFLVTVDGRKSNSVGMNLTEFSNYLVSLGAHAALNLDGGGSTTMAVRERGSVYPKLFNNPSDNAERAISAVLGAVSLTKTGPARSIEAKMTGPSSLLTGGKTAVQVVSALDTNFHVVQTDSSKVKYSVSGDIGTVSASGQFTATKAGKGSIIVAYENATKSFAIEVLNSPASITISGANGEVASNDQMQLSVKAFDGAGRELAFSPTIVKWEASASLGTISSTGLLKTNSSGKGTVTASIGSKSASMALSILNGGTVIHSFENSAQWEAASAKALTTVRFDLKNAPYKDGGGALTLSYDFRSYQDGTSASYAVAKTPIKITSKPTNLGLWVYGDGAGHWLRGMMTDGKGKSFTVDFTENGGLNWTGWKYVKAKIPSTVVGPIFLNRIYLAEIDAKKKNKGSIYVDKLIAEYGDSYVERLFNDIPNDYWAVEEISNAVSKGWINGYPDGTFKPNNNLTRAHAALLISRALKLPSGSVNPFKDVPASHRYAKEISAIYQAGIMSGKDAETFNPDGLLTRGQMAKILVKSYKLSADPSAYVQLKDVPSSFWGYDDIHVLQANGITIVPDLNYRPFDLVKRYQFAVFLSRAEK